MTATKSQRNLRAPGTTSMWTSWESYVWAPLRVASELHPGSRTNITLILKHGEQCPSLDTHFFQKGKMVDSEDDSLSQNVRSPVWVVEPTVVVQKLSDLGVNSQELRKVFIRLAVGH